MHPNAYNYSFWKPVLWFCLWVKAHTIYKVIAAFVIRVKAKCSKKFIFIFYRIIYKGWCNMTQKPCYMKNYTTMGAVHVKLAMKLPRCFSISTLSRSIAMLFKTITLLVNAIAIENILNSNYRDTQHDHSSIL
jgi:hypothetical protein